MVYDDLRFGPCLIELAAPEGPQPVTLKKTQKRNPRVGGLVTGNQAVAGLLLAFTLVSLSLYMPLLLFCVFLSRFLAFIRPLSALNLPSHRCYLGLVDQTEDERPAVASPAVAQKSV
jgi:hypothetical protein